MKYTGTLIEDLMAMVESAEQRTRSRQAMLAEPMLAEPTPLEPMLEQCWIPCAEPSPNYDSKLIGVA